MYAYLYPVYLTFVMAGVYIFLNFAANQFFRHRPSKVKELSFHSIVYIAAVSMLAYIVSTQITDKELGNRVLHAFGGGFTAFFICYRVMADARLPLNLFQFFALSFLVVTGLGVANEIMEYFFQIHLDLVFAPHPYDTWLDLISNTVGATIGGLVFLPLFSKYHDRKN